MQFDTRWPEFLAAIEAIERRCGYSFLDRVLQRTLEWVFSVESSHSVIYVETIVSKSGVASRAVLHRAIKSLEREGFLTLTPDPEDTRRRIVKTTPKTHKMMERLAAETVKLAARFR